MGRRPINDQPMTTAERKARSRRQQYDAHATILEEAAREAADWRKCLANGRTGATDRDIQAGFEHLEALIAEALLSIPRD